MDLTRSAGCRSNGGQSPADPNRLKLLITITVLAGAAILLFARLGHYALWDDEAQTALNAKGVLRTGDTSAVIDHNINAYRYGVLLRNLRDRFTAPLQAYVAAPSIALMGESALAARVPFALSGLACAALILWWLWKENASVVTSLLMGLGILGNASFFLFFRQARYYGLAMLASVVLAYLYLHWQGRPRTAILFAVVSIGLLGSNLMNFAAMYVCLAVDYLVWGRYRRSLKMSDWACLLTPLVVGGLLLLWVWNPIGIDVTGYRPYNWLIDRIKLFWWNWRDLNRSEFGVGLLLMSAPILYLRVRDAWLIRATVALFLYVLVITLVSPQAVGFSRVANVRYLAPTIPLCIAIGVLSLRALASVSGAGWVAVLLAVIAFGTNLLHGGPFVHQGPVFEKGDLSGRRLRSTIIMYINELLHPPTDHYRVTARWIDEHVAEGQSIWVVPNYMTASLMYHAPKAIYAWQLSYPPRPQFKDLPPIHFELGPVPPDYIVASGPVVRAVSRVIHSMEARGIRYSLRATLDTYWRDTYRPELLWRTFGPVARYDKNVDAVYVFIRVTR